MARIAIIDYGMSNLHSVCRALQRVCPGSGVTVTQDPRVLATADRVVFPGQGAIGACRQELERLDLLDAVARATREKPFFGMCLGPQMMMDFSEENGGVQGLGVFPGRVARFPQGLMDAAGHERLKVPHMGWNRVRQSLEHPLWEGIAQDAWFYFVHSFYLCPEQQEHAAGTTDYGLCFTSALARDNVFAVQFHPEKSARDGLRLLANFVTWSPG